MKKLVLIGLFFFWLSMMSIHGSENLSKEAILQQILHAQHVEHLTDVSIEAVSSSDLRLLGKTILIERVDVNHQFQALEHSYIVTGTLTLDEIYKEIGTRYLQNDIDPIDGIVRIKNGTWEWIYGNQQTTMDFLLEHKLLFMLIVFITLFILLFIIYFLIRRKIEKN